VLLPYAGSIEEADARLTSPAQDGFAAAIEAVPGEWHAGAGPDELRAFFDKRLDERAPWLEEAERARP
jgi:hypothetical protein